MKVLFISSGNTQHGISPIIKNQGESLKKSGVDLDYYSVNGRGVWGYLFNIPKLRKYIKENNYDLIHAHYSLSAIVASFAAAKPLVVSLMGSDVKAKSWFKFIIWVFYKLFWSITIIKSEDMKKSLDFKKVEIIPNGVDIDKFKPMDKNQCRKVLGWTEDKIHILFAANPSRYEKNYPLAKEAINQLIIPNIELHFLKDVNNNDIPTYMNAANVILLTSLWEGSPNVIKEAMACNRPIVATDVGDIKWLFGNINGHYICGFYGEDVSEKVKEALFFSKKHCATEGRNRILELNLDLEKVANRIIKLYKKVIKGVY